MPLVRVVALDDAIVVRHHHDLQHLLTSGSVARQRLPQALEPHLEAVDGPLHRLALLGGPQVRELAQALLVLEVRAQDLVDCSSSRRLVSRNLGALADGNEVSGGALGTECVSPSRQNPGGVRSGSFMNLFNRSVVATLSCVVPGRLRAYQMMRPSPDDTAYVAVPWL